MLYYSVPLHLVVVHIDNSYIIQTAILYIMLYDTVVLHLVVVHIDNSYIIQTAIFMYYVILYCSITLLYYIVSYYIILFIPLIVIFYESFPTNSIISHIFKNRGN